MGSSRVLPVSIPLDSPEQVLERLIAEDTSQTSPNGERSSMMNRELNGGLSAISSPVGGGKRDIFNRPFAGSKSLHNDDTDLEDGKEEKDRDKSHKAVKAHNQALLSGLAYCLSSCSMILVNKFVLSGYNFNAGIFLMVYQNFISVVVVSTLSFFGIISTEPLTWRIARVWLPVNVIFVGMLMTSIFSLKYINVAMVTILKNVTNVITAVGETYLFKKYHGGKVWAALMLMIVSAVSGGLTDLSFHAVGYTWQTLNCFLTASYSLTLRRIMDTAKQVTKSGNLNEFSMVLLNNVLSLPLGILLLFLCDEVDYLSKTPLLNMPMFWVVINDSKWTFRPCNQLHVYVVSSSDWSNHVQLGGIVEQDSTFRCRDRSIQCPNQLGEPHQYSFWITCWRIFCQSKDGGEIKNLKYNSVHPEINFVVQKNLIRISTPLDTQFPVHPTQLS